MNGLFLALVLACHEGSGTPPAPPGSVVWVDASRVASGTAVVLHAPSTTVLPTVEGLTARQTLVGDDGTATWELTGVDGSSIIEVPVPVGTDAGAAARTLYFDIGEEGPRSQLDDVLPPVPPAAARWPYIVLAVLVLAAGLWGAVWAVRRLRPPPPAPAPEAPDVLARRRWRELRAQSDVSPEPLAAALSDVYRHYLDASHAWPATARTTREILDNLAAELTAVQLQRARRLLGAMDLVKFSEHAELAGLFDALDVDFDALVVPVRQSLSSGQDAPPDGGAARDRSSPRAPPPASPGGARA